MISIELLYFVAMLATFIILLLVCKLNAGVSLMCSALVGGLLYAICSGNWFALNPRYYIEGKSIEDIPVSQRTPEVCAALMHYSRCKLRDVPLSSRTREFYIDTFTDDDVYKYNSLSTEECRKELEEYQEMQQFQKHKSTYIRMLVQLCLHHRDSMNSIKILAMYIAKPLKIKLKI